VSNARLHPDLVHEFDLPPGGIAQLT